MRHINSHIVQRVLMELSIPSEIIRHSTKWNDIQHSISRQIESILNKILSSLDRGEHLVIDSLEVNLGEIPFENTNQWINEIEKKLQKALKETLLSSRLDAQKKTGRTVILSEDKSGYEALVHFLTTGLLPWFMQGDHRPDPEGNTIKKDHGRMEELLSLSIRKYEKAFYAFLKENCHRNHIINRFIQIDQNGRKTIRFLAPALHNEALDAYQYIKQSTDMSFRTTAMAEWIRAVIQAGKSNRNFRYVLFLFLVRMSKLNKSKAHSLLISIKREIVDLKVSHSKKNNKLMRDSDWYFLDQIFSEEEETGLKEKKADFLVSFIKFSRALKENRAYTLRCIGQKKGWVKQAAIYLEKKPRENIAGLFPGIESSMAWLFSQITKNADTNVKKRLSYWFTETAVILSDEAPTIDESVECLIQVIQKDEPVFINKHLSKSQKWRNSDKECQMKPVNNKLNNVLESHSVGYEKTHSPKSKSGVLEEGCYIDHAGVVLIAPFLPSLFSRLSLLESRLFKSEHARGLAFQLITYMIYGHMKVPEYDLAMVKILCGMELEQDCLLESKPGKKEIAEADDLLNSVLVHWKALKSTSVEGLRHSFIQRKGMMRLSGDDWSLHVEPQAFDVLLSKLPWSISVISLPWMKQRIIVEWG